MPEDLRTPTAAGSPRRAARASARASARSSGRAAALGRVGRSAAGATLVVGLVTTGWAFSTSDHADRGGQVQGLAADTAAVDTAAVDTAADDARVPQIGDALVVQDVAEAGPLRDWLLNPSRPRWPLPPWRPAPAPAPVDPAPVDPAPVDPAPVDPAPEPEDPAPVDPAPEDPAPVDPAPEDPAPVDPTPEDPAPVDPAPEDPAPVDPAPEPEDPAPVDPAPEDPAPVDPEPAPATPEQAYSAETVRLVNAERAAAGLRPLVLNDCASQSAQEWAEYLAKSGEFKHQDMSAIAKRCGFTRGVGENIALHWETPAKMVQMWMESAGHKANILRTSYGAMGSGVARNSRGGWIAVHVFVDGTPAAR